MSAADSAALTRDVRGALPVEAAARVAAMTSPYDAPSRVVAQCGFEF